MADASGGASAAAPAAGRLLVCGATDWSAVGRVAAKDAAVCGVLLLPPLCHRAQAHRVCSQNPALPNLTEPHRMMLLEGVRGCAF